VGMNRFEGNRSGPGIFCRRTDRRGDLIVI